MLNIAMQRLIFRVLPSLFPVIAYNLIFYLENSIQKKHTQRYIS